VSCVQLTEVGLLGASLALGPIPEVGFVGEFRRTRSGVRDHVVLCWISMTAGTAGLVMAGLWTWNGWLQLAAPLVLAMVCTRLLAHVYFGWREPDEVPRRRARP
jgi:hypothetical protein